MSNSLPEDPFAEREAAKYDNPIPSREYIIDILRQADGPMSREQLTVALQLDEDEHIEALRRRLRAMERDGQLMRNRRQAYGLVDKMELLRGRVQAHRDGFGFMVPDDGSTDLFLHGRQMSKVFDGDEVLCRISGYDRRGRPEGVIVEVLQSHTATVVGRFFADEGIYFVRPDHPRINHEILIAPSDTLDAQAEQYVVVAITAAPGWQRPARGKVLEVLGDHMAPGLEIEVAIRAHRIPYEWSTVVQDEAQAFAAEPAEVDKQHRVDLRDLPLLTIDGEDAQDFDDAVYCEPKKGGGWRLWVAIADVSHYVAVGSALDEEARRRGNSVYFPGQVVPMLPEILSNQLCSLKPEVDRLCMVCEMTISAAGRLSSYRFFEGVMRSHARLTYHNVARMLDVQHPEGEKLRRQHRHLVPHLQALHALYQALYAARQTRGAIDFDTVETRIVFGAQRKIDTIVPVVRNDAHRLIEECMLCANVAAARFLQKHQLLALYRVHDTPKSEKLNALRKYLGELGLSLAGGNKPKSEHYQQLLQQISDRADMSVIQTVVLRSMNQALYQPENDGHFGLNFLAYTHFTSPIRRYPDLLVHRAIRSVIRSVVASRQVRRVDGAQPLAKAVIYPYDNAALATCGEQCSATERRADEATRDVLAWLKCEYLQDRVGEVFDGVIAAVTHFGLFVELAGLYVEGLIHVSALHSDYYHFDATRHRLVGERTRQVFQLGGKLTVRVVRVDLDDRKVDLELE